jgi:hypothetical protein
MKISKKIILLTLLGIVSSQQVPDFDYEVQTWNKQITKSLFGSIEITEMNGTDLNKIITLSSQNYARDYQA